MKRLIVLFILIVFIPIILFAKSIEIVSGEFQVNTSPNIDEVKAHCVFKNVSQQEISVKLKIKLIQATEGLDVAFCWGPVCYPPLTLGEFREPSDAISLLPGQTSGPNEFYLTFSPNGYQGEAIVEAILYVKDNPEDSLNLVFRLSTVLGVPHSKFDSQILAVSVTGDYFTLEKFGFTPGTIFVYTIDGKLLYKSFIFELLNISSFPKGLYLIRQLEPNIKTILVNKL
ncbi:MAG: hypothetical protein N2560_01090 [Ignavibacteria bacterium]|nr:hypothetical protein [Ignavibacteria bacterium]